MTTRPPARPRRTAKTGNGDAPAPIEAPVKAAESKAPEAKMPEAKMPEPKAAEPVAAPPAPAPTEPVSAKPAAAAPAAPRRVAPAAMLPRPANAAALGEVAQAFAESAGTLARGWNELSQLASDSMRGAVEMGLAAGRAAIGTRTPADLIELQRTYLRDSFDRAMTDGTRMTELSVRIAGEALAPLQARAGALFNRAGNAG